ncbi:MAG: FAD-binding oxidoreductase [Ruminiclostridium sp.]|nr:FAD-binding oxidoreductase [Ruminiclostridium sp.]
MSGLIVNISQEHDEYMRDESRKTGNAESISFPKTESEIIEIMKRCQNENKKVTIQGARTGITAGAVPQGGHVLNLSGMNRILGLRYDSERDILYITVQPGVLLTDLKKTITNKDFDTKVWKDSAAYFFPPDPTETSASIGGMVACNASGACSYHYGPTRNYIEGLRVVLPDGSTISLRRGEHKAKGRHFSLVTDTGRVIEGELPEYTMPDVKNASGYYIREDMDLVDLFIGSEGTLGIISQIELRLLKEPLEIWGLMFFFEEEDSAIKFVKSLRGDELKAQPAKTKEEPGDTEFCPAAIEYFNGDALELLRIQKESNAAFSHLAYVDRKFNSAVYVELHGDDEDAVMESMGEALERAESCGGCESDTWVASTAQLMESMKLFRHAVPEAVNLLIDQRRKKNPDITKLGTDMAVPDDRLEEVMQMYKADLLEQGFDSVMFGHIGDNHIHVNILPKSMEEYSKGKELYRKWAEKVLDVGGTVSAEHGIGKLKVNFLKMMYKQEGINGMEIVRRAFDPDCILNVGNLF